MNWSSLSALRYQSSTLFGAFNGTTVVPSCALLIVPNSQPRSLSVQNSSKRFRERREALTVFSRATTIRRAHHEEGFLRSRRLSDHRGCSAYSSEGRDFLLPRGNRPGLLT